MRFKYLPESVREVVLRMPMLLLADIWYRGCDSVRPCAVVVQAVNGSLWNEAWPPSHFSYIRHALILSAFCLLCCLRRTVVWLYYGSWSTVLGLHCAYLLCQLWSFTDPLSPAASNSSDTVGTFSYYIGLVMIVFCNFLFWKGSLYVLVFSFTEVCMFSANPRLFVHLYILPVILYLLSWPVPTIFWVNTVVCRLAVAVTPVFIFLDLTIICLPVGIDVAKFVHRCCVQRNVTDVNFCLSTLTPAIATSWLLVFTSHFAAVYLHPSHETNTFIDLLSAAVCESASSPFCLVGVCCAVSYLTRAVARLAVVFMHFTRDDVSVDFETCRIDDLKVALFQATVAHLLNISLSDNISLLLMLMLVRKLPWNLIPEISSLLVSTLGGRRSWLRVRLLFVCLVLFAVPILATVHVGVTFGLTGSEFLLTCPALFVPVQIVQIVLTHLVDEYDAKNDNNNVIDYTDEIVETIKEYSMYVDWIVVGVSCLLAICLLLAVDDMWAVILQAVLIFIFYAWEPYLSDQAAKHTRQVVKQAVQELSRPSIRHLKRNRTCVICQTEMMHCRVSREMPCRHMFHSRCLVRWLHVQPKCPICGFEVPLHDDTFGFKSALETIDQRFSTILYAYRHFGLLQQ